MKKIFRQQIVNQRKLLSPKVLLGYNQQFLRQFIAFLKLYQTTHRPKIIGGYVPINNELNALPLLDYCRSVGYKTALPYCHGLNIPLSFHAFDGNELTLKPDKYQIPAPNSTSPVIIPDLIICPSVGVCSHSNKRLGYGGGFFDRYHGLHPHCHFVAGFSDFQVIHNPAIFAPHDLNFHKVFILN
ncbi:MAG: 5-formyltetrahydrofolate cyclo-ligase [Dasania sp.]|jgi:5-formyltetrahydrofolate cyclo-ligase